jgi:hypothetical protein
VKQLVELHVGHEQLLQAQLFTHDNACT